MFYIFTLLFVVAGAVAIYYVYIAIFGSTTAVSTMLVSGQQAADATTLGKMATIPQPYEGGDYTVNMWLYISSYNKNHNRRKHVFELKGKNFSTLLVGLGAFKNTLMVRTHSKDVSEMAPGAGPTGPAGTTAPPNVEDAMRSDGTLKRDDVTSMFKEMAMDDSLLNTPPVCDLTEVDLQRWTMVTVVISGRTIDVYMDGKLKRSCVTRSYFKVDPTGGITASVCENGGFDGFVSNVGVSNYSLNPDEIYKLYTAGPGGATWDITKWIASVFTGSSAS